MSRIIGMEPAPGLAPEKEPTTEKAAVPTKADLKARLDELGVAYKKSANVADLAALVAGAEAELAAKAAEAVKAAEAAGDDDTSGE